LLRLEPQKSRRQNANHVTVRGGAHRLCRMARAQLGDELVGPRRRVVHGLAAGTLAGPKIPIRGDLSNLLGGQPLVVSVIELCEKLGDDRCGARTESELQGTKRPLPRTCIGAVNFVPGQQSPDDRRNGPSFFYADVPMAPTATSTTSSAA